jgi:hypothetical protein
MLARLEALDGRKRVPNQYRDILIAETAIKNGLTLTAWPLAARAQRPKGKEGRECQRFKSTHFVLSAFVRP